MVRQEVLLSPELKEERQQLKGLELEHEGLLRASQSNRTVTQGAGLLAALSGIGAVVMESDALLCCAATGMVAAVGGAIAWWLRRYQSNALISSRPISTADYLYEMFQLFDANPAKFMEQVTNPVSVFQSKENCGAVFAEKIRLGHSSEFVRGTNGSVCLQYPGVVDAMSDLLPTELAGMNLVQLCGFVNWPEAGRFLQCQKIHTVAHDRLARLITELVYKITPQQLQEVTFASQMSSILDQSRSAFFTHRLTKAEAAFQERELRLIAELEGPACVGLSMSRLLDEHYGAADAIKMRVDTSGHMSWWSSDKKATLGPRLVAVLRAFMATELDSILPSELEQASGWTLVTGLSKGMQAKLVDAEDLQLLKHLKAQRADAERLRDQLVGSANDALRQAQDEDNAINMRASSRTQRDTASLQSEPTSLSWKVGRFAGACKCALACFGVLH